MDKSTANMILNVEKLKSWPVGPEQDKIALSPLLFNIELGLPLQHSEKNKRNKIGNKQEKKR